MTHEILVISVQRIIYIYSHIILLFCDVRISIHIYIYYIFSLLTTEAMGIGELCRGTNTINIEYIISNTGTFEVLMSRSFVGKNLFDLDMQSTIYIYIYCDVFFGD